MLVTALLAGFGLSGNGFRPIAVCVAADDSRFLVAVPGDQAWEIEDGGRTRVFELAADEICVTRPGGKRECCAIANSDGIRGTLATAAVIGRATGREVRLVLYEKGVLHNEFTRRILTRRVLVRAGGRINPARLASDSGAALVSTPAFAPGYFVLETVEVDGALRLAPALRAREGVLSAEPILGKKLSKKLVPNDVLFDHQWHLLNRGQLGTSRGIDLNLTNVWERFRGNGVMIGIVDDGLQLNHPDLAPNILANLGYDYRDGDADPSSSGDEDYHGTQIAGVAAGRGNNALGIAGVAFDASLAAIRLIGGLDQTDEQNAAAMMHSNQVVQVSNNSWGAPDDGETLDGPGPLMKLALEFSARNGRGGKGTVFVWSGGNGRTTQDNSNYDGYANSIYTIAVAALNDQGQQASYSEPGACLLIAAPAEAQSSAEAQAITTTDLTGDGGQNFNGVVGDLADRNYTQHLAGTSAVTPMVSGIAALMLQANPNLGWRDVQEILIRSAARVDTNDSDWTTNGVGLHFNHKYGAGLVDADAAIKLASGWTVLGAQTNLFREQTNLAQTIPDNDPNGVWRTFDLRSFAPLRVEHVTVTADIAHTRRGDLAITLVSPAGTRSRLAEKHLDSGENYTHWTFMTVFNWGETSQGEWKVHIADLRPTRSGTIRALRLDVFGTVGGLEAPPVLTPIGFDTDGFHFNVTDFSGLPFEVQRSSNLAAWTLLVQTNSAAGPVIGLVDPAPAAFTERFYRVVRSGLEKIR